MAQLLVGLEDTLIRRLEEQAASHGVSVEEEHRQILRKALSQKSPEKPSLIEFLLSDRGRVSPEVELNLTRNQELDSRDAGF